MDLAKLDRRRFLGAAGCLPFVPGCPACARSLYDAPSGRATGRNLRDIVSGRTVDVHTHILAPSWFGRGGQTPRVRSDAEIAAELGANPYLPLDDAAALVRANRDIIDAFEVARADGSAFASAAVLIAEMDRAGIDVSVCQLIDEINRPYRRAYTVDMDTIFADLKAVSDAYPGRFIHYFGVDPRRGAEGVALLRRAVTEFGFAGMGEWITQWWRVMPTDRAVCYPYFEACVELGIPYVNNGSGPDLSHTPEVFEQVLTDFQTLKVLNAGTGVMTDRELAADPARTTLPERLLDVAERHGNFYLDIDDWQRLDAAGNRRTISFLRRALDGPAGDRIMFGTDFPIFTQIVPAASFVDALINATGSSADILSDDDINRLFSRNPLSFLSMKNP
ncbi:amidohydrolase family protein [Brevundimonas sp.]|uniref:amidohydrolase family protein n=1 Tax=Brevundimonas sp. TaxID=1871086 RepID=UPI0022C697ED|nr:amidohydrolase family protein [Brevundimonas sp.]MCZ8194824.1 amidohydrolase family protein [Brevundimonas sp.]